MELKQHPEAPFTLWRVCLEMHSEGALRGRSLVLYAVSCSIVITLVSIWYNQWINNGSLTRSPSSLQHFAGWVNLSVAVTGLAASRLTLWVPTSQRMGVWRPAWQGRALTWLGSRHHRPSSRTRTAPSSSPALSARQTPRTARPRGSACGACRPVCAPRPRSGAPPLAGASPTPPWRPCTPRCKRGSSRCR